jgi:uncharacterized membrane protein
MSYPPSSYPPSGDYQGGGGFPPPEGGGKTKTLNLDYNIAAMLCYLPLCCIPVVAEIIWLATEPKESRFVRFHALQGLLLFIAGAVIGGVIYVLGFVLAFISSALTFIFLLLALLWWAVWVVVLIIASVKAYQNQMWKLPVIGDFAESKL